MGGQSSPLVTSPTNRWKNPNPDKPSKISIQSFWHFFEPFFFVILNQNFLRPSAALPTGPTLFQWTRTGGSAAWLGGCGSAPLRLGQVFQSGWIDAVPFLPFVHPSMGVGKKFFFLSRDDENFSKVAGASRQLQAKEALGWTMGNPDFPEKGVFPEIVHNQHFSIMISGSPLHCHVDSLPVAACGSSHTGVLCILAFFEGPRHRRVRRFLKPSLSFTFRFSRIHILP